MVEILWTVQSALLLLLIVNTLCFRNRKLLYYTCASLTVVSAMLMYMLLVESETMVACVQIGAIVLIVLLSAFRADWYPKGDIGA